MADKYIKKSKDYIKCYTWLETRGNGAINNRFPTAEHFVDQSMNPVEL